MSQPRSRASRAAEEADADPDLGEAINECARFLICREGSKIPIKRAEIQKFLAPNFQIPSNRINVVISEANKLIRKVIFFNYILYFGFLPQRLYSQSILN